MKNSQFHTPNLDIFIFFFVACFTVLFPCKIMMSSSLLSGQPLGINTEESLLVVGSVLQKPPNPLFTTTGVYCHRNDSWDPRFNITAFTAGPHKRRSHTNREKHNQHYYYQNSRQFVALKERAVVNDEIKMHEWAMLLGML